MKTTHKKKKKKGSRKTKRSRPEPKAIVKSDSVSDIKEKDEKGKSQQIVPKRASEKRPESKGHVITGYINVAIQFLRDAKMELKKVKWPTRKELLASTVIVIFLVLVVAFFLGLIDFGLIKIIKKIVG